MKDTIGARFLRFGRAVAAILFPGRATALASVASEDMISFFNPALRPYLPQISALMPKDPPLGIVVADDRKHHVAWPIAPLPDVPVAERRIPGPAGAPDVLIQVINAKPGLSRPAILYTHGGGFVLGRAADELAMAQTIAAEIGCVVVNVEYRLAPETTWQGSTEDNYAALKWLYANVAELGVNPAKIAVMGGSAGGGHAALLAILARDRGEIPLAFQCLTYPMLDDRTGANNDARAYDVATVWTSEQNRYAWGAFLGQTAGGADVPAAAVPARVENLAGLPPAWIGVGSIDLFVDEDVQYARRLIEAGVMTELVVVPGACHGFDALPLLLNADIPICGQFVASRTAALRRALIEG